MAISGRPTTGNVTIRLEGAFGFREKAAPCAAIAQKGVLGPLPEGKKLKLTLHLEAEQLAHRDGTEEADPAASGAAVWVAQPGQTQASHVVFGPYSHVEAGGYLALFRLKRRSEGKGDLAHLDTHSPGNGVSSLRKLCCHELPLDQYRWIALPFAHPGGLLETRVYWPGKAAVAVDCVAVWAIID